MVDNRGDDAESTHPLALPTLADGHETRLDSVCLARHERISSTLVSYQLARRARPVAFMHAAGAYGFFISRNKQDLKNVRNLYTILATKMQFLRVHRLGFHYRTTLALQDQPSHSIDPRLSCAARVGA